jgi:hypothetical protein
MSITALTRKHNKHAYEPGVPTVHPSIFFLLFTLTFQLYLPLPRHLLPPFAFLIKFSCTLLRSPIRDTYTRNKVVVKFLTSAAFGAGWITTVPNIQYFLVIIYLKTTKELRYHNFYHIFSTYEGLVSKKYQIQKIQNSCNRWCYMS